MRSFAIIVVLLWLTNAQPAFGQQINYVAKNVSLETVFKQVEKQAGYSFFYKTELIRQMPPVSVRFRNLSIVQAMDECLRNLPLVYIITDHNISVTAKQKDNNLISIKGRLTDELNNPLEGATVKLKNFTNGALTNSDGEFTIQVSGQEKKVLHFL